MRMLQKPFDCENASTIGRACKKKSKINSLEAVTRNMKHGKINKDIGTGYRVIMHYSGHNPKNQ